MSRAVAWVAAVVMLVLVGCKSPAHEGMSRAPVTKTDGAFVERFLRSWLIERDLARAEQFLHRDFRLVNGADPTWPETLKAMPERERALHFALQCYGAPAECTSVDECVRPVERSNGDGQAFDLAVVVVDEDMAAANEYLRPLKGQKLMQVNFILRGCNIGTSMLIAPDGSSNARILSTFYIAG